MRYYVLKHNKSSGIERAEGLNKDFFGKMLGHFDCLPYICRLILNRNYGRNQKKNIPLLGSHERGRL